VVVCKFKGSLVGNAAQQRSNSNLLRIVKT